MPKLWSEKDTDTAIKMVKSGHTLEEVGAHLGRTKSAVQNKIQYMGIVRMADFINCQGCGVEVKMLSTNQKWCKPCSRKADNMRRNMKAIDYYKLKQSPTEIQRTRHIRSTMWSDEWYQQQQDAMYEALKAEHPEREGVKRDFTGGR